MKFFASNHWLWFIFKLTTLWHKWQVSELVLTDFEHSILYDYRQKGFNFKFQKFFFSTYVHLCLKITISTKPLLPANNWMDIPNPPSGKKNRGGWENIFLWKTPQKFLFFYFTTGNSQKTKAQPLEILQAKLCYHRSALVPQKMF